MVVCTCGWAPGPGRPVAVPRFAGRRIPPGRGSTRLPEADCWGHARTGIVCTCLWLPNRRECPVRAFAIPDLPGVQHLPAHASRELVPHGRDPFAGHAIVHHPIQSIGLPVVLLR